jgi:rhodanese-related sulfurtransferase
MSNVHRVSPEEAKKLVDDEGYTYVDVRTEAEYAAGHPQGAQNVPILNAGAKGMEPNPDFMTVMSAAYPKDAKLVVGCKAGGRSLKAAQALLAAGYTNIVDQRAGWDGARDSFGAITEEGWSKKGWPTETATAGGSYAEVRKKGAV